MQLYSTTFLDHSTPPSARKSFVDSVCSNPSQISELRKSKADWKLIVKSRDTAEAIVDHIKGKQPTINASLRPPNFIGVVKRIPVEMEEQDVLYLIPRACKVVRIES